MSTCYVLMWLEASLQSWGFDSKFGRRDTLDFPTKSGVLGLICCALGAGGEQHQFLARMRPLTTTVLAFSRDARISPKLNDFHMVGAGYDAGDRFERQMIPKTTEGNKAVGGGTKLTHRYYLQDVVFAVALEVPQDLSNTISEALQNPVWDLYLGRKNSVPTDFIYRGVYAQEQQAVDQALAIANEKSLSPRFRVIDGEHDGEVLTLSDVPVQFGIQKKYSPRRVTVVVVS